MIKQTPTLHFLSFLYRYAQSVDKTMVIENSSPLEKIELVKKGYENSNSHKITQDNFKNYVSSYESIFTFFNKEENTVLSYMDGLSQCEKVKFLIEFSHQDKKSYNSLLHVMSKTISFKDIMVYSIKEKTVTDTMSLLETMSIHHLIRMHRDDSIDEIKNYKFLDSFYSFLVSYFDDKKILFDNNEDLQQTFAKVMYSSVVNDISLSQDLINKYPFLKQQFNDLIEENTDDVVDFKRVRINLLTLNIELNIKDPNTIVKVTINSLKKSESLKNAGLLDIVLHETNSNTADVFLGLSEKSKLSYTQVETIIKKTIRQCFDNISKDSLNSVIDAMVLEHTLPQKETKKSIKI